MKPAYLSLTPNEGETGGQFKRRMQRARAEWYRDRFAGQPTTLPWSKKPKRPTRPVQATARPAQGTSNLASKRKRYAGLGGRGVTVEANPCTGVPRWHRRRKYRKGAR